jgi:hypothetical protein
MGAACHIQIMNANTKLWEKRFEEDEIEVIQEAELHFGIEALGNRDLFFKEATFVDRVSETVHFIGLRHLLLLGALFLDFFVMVGRQIGVLSFPEFPDHPIKTFLGRIGAREQILDQTNVYIKYWHFDRDVHHHTESNYQINPDPFF